MFVTQGPVDPSSRLFVGREAELVVAEEWLKTVRCVGAVLGARQTGKTSFLLRLREALRPKYAFAFVNLEAIVDADIATCFGYISQEIADQLEGFLSGAKPSPAGDDRSFLSFLSALSSSASAVRIAILLDELGALPTPTATKLAHTLRAVFTNRLVNRSYGRFFFLLAGSTDMLNLTTGHNSPLKNVTESIYMGDFSRKESDALISAGLSDERVASENVKREIHSWTSGHPYWTQLLGSALGAQVTEVDRVGVERLVNEMFRMEDKNLPHLRRGLPDERQELWGLIDRLLDGDTDISFFRSDARLAELELLGVIKERDGRCVFRNRIYRDALSQWRGRPVRSMVSTKGGERVLKNAYALLIGVGNYDHERFPSLPVTVADARAIADLLSDPERGGYSPEHVTVLTREAATTPIIRQSLNELLAKTDSDSTVLVFFSGHGGRALKSGAWQSYLCGRDADPDDLDRTAISGAEFSDFVAALPARRVLVILDACHAGGSATLKAAMPGHSSWKSGLPETYYDSLGRGSGRIVIASSKEDQYSYVRDELSLFTYHLAEALSGRAAVRGDGLVHVLDVFHFVNEAVQVERPEQVPILKVKDLDLNFPIAAHQGGRKAPTPSGPTPTGSIRDHIVRDPVSGARELAEYLKSHASGADRRQEVDLKRAELIQCERDAELFGPTDIQKAARSRAIYFLLKVCAEFENPTS